MAIERLNPDTVHSPPNDAYSQVVKATGGTHIHLSGMVGLDGGGDIVSMDMREQTVQVLEMLTNALDAAGADVSDVVRVRVLTTDAGEFLQRCHGRVVEWCGDDKPASTLHEVAGLAFDELEVEVEATAIVDS